jgi:hypothetical protein
MGCRCCWERDKEWFVLLITNSKHNTLFSNRRKGSGVELRRNQEGTRTFGLPALIGVVMWARRDRYPDQNLIAWHGMAC